MANKQTGVKWSHDGSALKVAEEGRAQESCQNPGDKLLFTKSKTHMQTASHTHVHQASMHINTSTHMHTEDGMDMCHI